MTWWRGPLIAARLIHPYWLTPWRSPLLRWRMETYGVYDPQGRPLHADDLTAAEMIRFVVRHRSALRRFIRWAVRL